MFDVFITVVLGAVFAVCAVWVTQHVLGTAVGWVRGILFVAVVYAATVPIVRAALEAGDVMVDGQFQVANGLGVVFIALALGWQFAIAVTAIMLSELFWPTGRGWHPIRTVKGFFQRRQRMRRYMQTLRIASKYGLSLYGSHRHHEQQDIPGALVGAMNEAGVTFVKIGQVLSTRDDILPPEYVKALSTLQMETTPLPWADVKAAIESELGGPTTGSFEWINEAPLATASLAQVHTARLLPVDGEQEGTEVIVKVQRPEARASVEIDSDIIVRLAAQAERRAAWARAFGLNALAAEFVRSLAEELDYRIELANTELLRDTLAKSSVKTIHVPAVYPALCTERMMVQEFVTGTPFAHLNGGLPEAMADAPTPVHTETKAFDLAGVSGVVSHTAPAPLPTAREIADSLVDTLFEQVAVRGIFHADLHPGNIILRADREITLIDFGSVGILERSMRRALIAMMAAMDAEDDIALTDLLLMVAGTPVDGSELDRAGLQHEIGVILTKVHNGPTDAAIFGEVLGVLQHHQLALPPALVLVFRTIASLEGTVRRLVPGYDMVEQALSRTTHFASLTFSPKELFADARVQLQVMSEQLRRMPRRIETIGSQLENGTFGLNLRMFRDPMERNWVASLIGQLTTALVGTVLIIAAVVLLVSGGGPTLTPEVGLFPFLGAVLGLAGMLLVLRTLRTALMGRTSMR
jgi:ubiquinone biosynthesis protein